MHMRKTAVLILLVLVFIFFAEQQVSAFGISKSGAFGGKITNIEFCSCLYDFGSIITIDDVATGRSLNLKYMLYSVSPPFFSLLRPNYNILKTGVNILGGATKLGILSCLNQKTYYCDSSGTQVDGIIDNIRGVGTSKK
jgi:hypothetical protein